MAKGQYLPFVVNTLPLALLTALWANFQHPFSSALIALISCTSLAFQTNESL